MVDAPRGHEFVPSPDGACAVCPFGPMLHNFPATGERIDLDFVDVWACPMCGSHFEESGPVNIITHIRDEHPVSEAARAILAVGTGHGKVSLGGVDEPNAAG